MVRTPSETRLPAKFCCVLFFSFLSVMVAVVVVVMVESKHTEKVCGKSLWFLALSTGDAHSFPTITNKSRASIDLK